MTSEAEEKVNASRNLIDRIVKENRVVYGITTGFGKFARTVIEKGKVFKAMQSLTVVARTNFLALQRRY